MIETSRLRPKFTWIAITLLAFISAEVLILTFGSRVSLSGVLSPAMSMATEIGRGAYLYGGPVLFPLLLLTALLLYVTYRLFRIYSSGIENRDLTAKLYKALGVIENISMTFGMLGTCIGILIVMKGLEPGQNQAEVIKVFMSKAASAFGSTIYGAVLFIISRLTREGFENFLLADTTENNLIKSKKVKFNRG